MGFLPPGRIRFQNCSLVNCFLIQRIDSSGVCVFVTENSVEVFHNDFFLPLLKVLRGSCSDSYPKNLKVHESGGLPMTITHKSFSFLTLVYTQPPTICQNYNLGVSNGLWSQIASASGKKNLRYCISLNVPVTTDFKVQFAL